MNLISVIIPVYNQEKTLVRAVESVLNQTYQNLEIILVDDGSTDGSGLLCDQYGIKDKRIKVIHQANKGLASARNIGINESTGKYICFLDSDDYIEINAYETMLNLLEKHNADIACIGVDVFNDKGHIKYFNEKLDEEIICNNKKEALHYHAVSENKYISTASWDKIYRREIVLSKLFDEGKIYEDLRVMSYWLYKANKVVYKNIPLYHYYQNSNSITHGKFNEKWFSWIDANETRADLYKKVAPEDLKYLNNTYIDNVLSIIYKARKNKKYQSKIKELSSNLHSFCKANDVMFTKKTKAKYTLFKLNLYLYYLAMDCYQLLRKDK